jgi:hypothetical protein
MPAGSFVIDGDDVAPMVFERAWECKPCGVRWWDDAECPRCGVPGKPEPLPAGARLVEIERK